MTQGQFKNKFVMHSMAMLSEQFEVNPTWNISTINRGEGPKDATVKKMAMQRVNSEVRFIKDHQ